MHTHTPRPIFGYIHAHILIQCGMDVCVCVCLCRKIVFQLELYRGGEDFIEFSLAISFFFRVLAETRLQISIGIWNCRVVFLVQFGHCMDSSVCPVSVCTVHVRNLRPFAKILNAAMSARATSNARAIPTF